jgi:hypothetical protein
MGAEVWGKGSLCGVVNGAFAALSLFGNEKSALDALIAELRGYYETAQLPLFARRRKIRVWLSL